MRGTVGSLLFRSLIAPPETLPLQLPVAVPLAFVM